MAVSEKEFNELKERVEMLIQVVINKDGISSLALQNGWNFEQVEQIYKIMEKFASQEQKSYNFQTIDACFHKEMELDYQVVKSILCVFYQNRSFLQVIKQYLKSNLECNKNLPSEFNDMFNELDKNPNI